MALGAGSAVGLAADVAPPTESAAARDARMGWWREAKFGCFVHWGLYAVPAGRWQGQTVGGIGEWIMQNKKIPVTEYAAFAGRFNPVKFDPDGWARLARDAGMKYVVITSKHHDGFALFHSHASGYNVVDATPFKRDIIRELGDACRRQGLKFGVYYSQAQDWHHAGGAAIGGHWDPRQDGDMDAYLRAVAVPQVRELLTGYDPAILWWDTPEGMTKERAAPFVPLLALRPGLITNNRLGGGVAGDTETPEQEIPATGLGGRDWETCMTINDTWGFKQDDHNWKPAAALLHNLVDIASKGGNYLLNVGPDAEGVIPPPCAERLRAIGAWLTTNGEAVYGTTAGPFRRLPWGRCTAKPGRLFLHVFDWPADGKLVVPGLMSRVTKAWSLADPAKALPVTRGADGWTVTVPAAAPDPVDAVVVLALDGVPLVEPPRIRAEQDGSMRLAAVDAEVHGGHARYESGGGKDNIGYWTTVDDWVEWALEVGKSGVYTVEISYACEQGTGGATFALTAPGARLTGTVRETGSWTTFIKEPLGSMQLVAGRQRIAVRPRSMPRSAVMNLKAVRLAPVREHAGSTGP